MHKRNRRPDYQRVASIYKLHETTVRRFAFEDEHNISPRSLGHPPKPGNMPSEVAKKLLRLPLTNSSGRASLLVMLVPRFVVLLLLWVSSTAAITRNERGALKLLYWATHGQRWVGQWDIQNEHSDPCLDNWYGIVCGRNGRIQSIRLANNNLVGVLPPEFPRKDLSGLQELDLSSNFLTGYVPETLSLLTALRTLRLDQNHFIGAIPASLAELTKLEFLELQANNFDVLNRNGGVLPEVVQRLTDPERQHCHIIS